MKNIGSSEKRLLPVFIVAVITVAIGLLMAGAAVAHTDEDELAVGKELVEKGTNCDNLTDEQLETVGEYLMGLMHPGDAHELMHQRMGIEEGTPYHEKFHINMAQAMYCGEAPMDGMMGMMPMMMNMMGGNMMSGQTPAQTNMMQGMMGSGGYGSGYLNLLNVLYVVMLLGLIALVYFWLMKLWKGQGKKSVTKRK